MRMLTFLLFTTFLAASASGVSQKVTLSGKSIPLKQVFAAIKKQTGYVVLYNEALLVNVPPVSISAEGISLQELLKIVLSSQPFEYVIEDKTIAISLKLAPSSRATGAEKAVLMAFLEIRGVVRDDLSNPLVGATVQVKGKRISAVTDSEGRFALSADVGDVLVVSYVGFKSKELKVKDGGVLEIKLVRTQDDLEEVKVVSTGYQLLPKDRATGSFTTIDEKSINRSVGINILDRLEGITSGLTTSRPSSNGVKEFNIHGRSTIFASRDPLIVLNGFPYEGTIDQINPADIESVTILKDAAASSIWGARSGNGVIVLTTKSGRKNQPLALKVSSSYTLTGRQDLYYKPQLSSAEFIELEQFLFSKGYFTSQFSNPYTGVSPVVEILNQRKLNRISAVDSAAQIDALKNYDVRDDLNRYIYRSPLHQQYQLNVSGGSNKHKYYMSGGYDKNQGSNRADSYERLNLNANNTFLILNDRLELAGDISFISSNTNINANTYNPRTPYDRLADENGNSLAVVGQNTFRSSYVDTAGNGKLLDWSYRPKDDLLVTNSRTKLNQYRIKAGINFKIIEGLNVSANYQYLNEISDAATNQDVNSYYTRHLINKYSSINNNVVTRVIPLNDYLSESNTKLSSETVRGLVNYNKIIAGNHEINAIAGYDASDRRTNSKGQVYYGYNPETLVNANATINPFSSYKYYYGTSSGTISIAPNPQRGSIDINQSYYGNFSYTYKTRYILSGSARRDESNLFGVKTNQKGVPLWSAGLAWNVTKEDFFKTDFLSDLKLRLTYGYNGNVDKSVSALLTSSNGSTANWFGSLYGRIVNPPNPSLRWEKVKTWNIGIDFTLRNKRIVGSIDAYQKNAVDLIGNSPIAFQTGIAQFKGNSASLQTNGLDLVLNSQNLLGKLQWNTRFLLNYNVHKVTSYKIKGGTNFSIVGNSNPLEGYPMDVVFSYPYAGLDATGAVQGYLNGEVSKDVSKILNGLDFSMIKHHGSATPKYAGSIINTLAYKKFQLSFNIIYKFDFYFRRGNVFSGGGYGSASLMQYDFADFGQRWKKAGDEMITKIPALLYPEDSYAFSFFSGSDFLVQRGDHIRLQDINLSYNVSERALAKSLVKRASIFVYVRNIGILWRANNYKIDPDYRTGNIPLPISGSVGINLTL